jgi:hypothetical protein
MYAPIRTRSTRTVIALPSGRFLLGALTAEQATEQIFPQAKVTGSAGHNAQARNVILWSAEAGQLIQNNQQIAYAPGSGDCAGVSLVKPALTSTVGGLALKFAPQAFAAGGPVAGAVTLAIAGIGELFGAIFGHHAAAVAKERSILCAAVPAADQSIVLIDQAVSAGQATPAQAMSALDSVVSGFQSAVGSIIHGSDPMSSGQCNAACVMLSALRAIVVQKKSVYEDLAAQQAQAAQATAAPVPAPGAAAQISSVLTGAKVSSVLPWAAAALGLWFILQEG